MSVPTSLIVNCSIDLATSISPFFGREHHGRIVFVDFFGIVAEHAVDEDVVLIGRRFENLNAEPHELLGHLLEVFARAKRRFGQFVVDVGERHPAAGSAKPDEFAVAVLRCGRIGVDRFKPIRFGGLRPGLNFIGFFAFDLIDLNDGLFAEELLLLRCGCSRFLRRLARARRRRLFSGRRLLRRGGGLRHAQ